MPEDGTSSGFPPGNHFSVRQRPDCTPIHESARDCRLNDACVASPDGLCDIRHDSRSRQLGHSRLWLAASWVVHHVKRLLALRHSNLATLRFLISGRHQGTVVWTNVRSALQHDLLHDSY